MRRLAVYIALLLSLAPLFAIGQEEEHRVMGKSTETQEKITITDSKGRDVTIIGPVKRIAFSHYAIGEGIKIVDAWDMVVGKDGYTSDKIIFPNLDELPLIAKNPYDINYEILFDLDVDLLITADIPMGGFDEMVLKLAPDIPVVALDLLNPETIEENIMNLGAILGKDKEAREYITWYKSVIHKIKMRTNNLKEEDKTHYLQKTGWEGSIMTFTDESPGIIPRNNITGSINVAAAVPSQGGWVSSLDLEWIASQEIDVIINFDIVLNGYGTEVDDDSIFKTYREKIMKNPIYSNTEAIKNNRFYLITNVCWGTPRNIIGYCYMAKWFHPELFLDFDPQKIHQEYLTQFMRIDYDLNKHGVFVYPKE